MTWLTWRQFRGAAVTMSAVLVAFTAFLALSGPELASDYSTGVTACTLSGDCASFFDRFFDEYEIPFLAVTVTVLVLPGLLGLFWGAPLITRELEGGTHLMVWSQSVTRARWLAVKLALTGLAAMTAAGLCGLAVTWWSAPLDKSAAAGFALMDPLVFGARGIVPMGYAAFALVLGVTVGMLVRRTLSAMAVTLIVFTALQIAMPLMVRPHLLPPVRSSFELDTSNVDAISSPPGGESARVSLDPAIPGHPGAWVLSSRLLDPSGRPAAADAGGAAVPVSLTSGPCGPSERTEQAARAGHAMDPCLAEINRLGYRQEATYQPFDRFWLFQWIETGVYALLTLGVTGFCFWWIRRRMS
ncbi:ABC-2 transporter permease [Sphaerisporangium rhizosphaerae]|uniref:ABC transporter permease n=1 Tax=Sphaerisporangium rhizosphaerae TaxID=2269375 RepID=A0ABW2P8W6_9ACTN